MTNSVFPTLPAQISPFDVESLRKQVAEAQPFPFFYLDNFLQPEFAEQVLNSFPSYADAQKVGREFKAVNERSKGWIAVPLERLNRSITRRWRGIFWSFRNLSGRTK